jgi:endonuclease/exonuclease/phosphatase family metal-dependent hydrolase
VTARLLALLLLLLPSPLAAAELKLATWNLEWLTLRPAGDPVLPADVRPKDAADIGRLRRYAEILAADVVAFQEVDGPEVAARVFPPGRYALVLTADRVTQRTGFALDRRLRFTANPDLVALDPYPGARHRLRSGADVTLDLPEGRLRLLAVHLKQGCRQDRLAEENPPACATLRLQLAALQGWVARRRDEGIAFVLMGDFNRWMDGHDQFWPALNAAAPLRRATAGRSSPCWGGGGFIDHIIAGGAARAWMQPETLRVLVYRETGPQWRDHLPDHCPVSVRFLLPDQE